MHRCISQCKVLTLIAIPIGLKKLEMKEYVLQFLENLSVSMDVEFHPKAFPSRTKILVLS